MAKKLTKRSSARIRSQLSSIWAFIVAIIYFLFRCYQQAKLRPCLHRYRQRFSRAFLKRCIFINTCFHQQLLSNFWKFGAYRVFSRVIFSYRLVQLLLAAIFSYPQRLLCRLGIISLKKQPPKKGYLARKQRWHLRINRSFPI